MIRKIIEWFKGIDKENDGSKELEIATRDAGLSAKELIRKLRMHFNHDRRQQEIAGFQPDRRSL